MARMTGENEILDKPDKPGLYWLEEDDTPRWLQQVAGEWVWWSPGALDYLPVSGRVAKVGPNPFLKGGAE